ncbi:unnamed protein product [Cylicocyclus nassatus]|uniref:Uncharacterized protein n=1 Tax=Cylicocyclus nassatus TaxID=53992 RepID=A0AA36DKS2_CYLNA|nr:unnamed protein product [Cylicocyclus nassatus]
MNSIFLVLAAAFVLCQRADAFPFAYPVYSSFTPVVHAVAPVAPVVHAAPVYPMGSPRRELHNIAGARRRESELLTDVAIRFPMKKAHKNR